MISDAAEMRGKAVASIVQMLCLSATNFSHCFFVVINIGVRRDEPNVIQRSEENKILLMIQPLQFSW